MTPEKLRQLAQRCRELATKSVVPEVQAQLAQWALEFEAEADPASSLLTEETARRVLNTMAVSRRKDGDDDQSG
jgi:hypothetical protein